MKTMRFLTLGLCATLTGMFGVANAQTDVPEDSLGYILRIPRIKIFGEGQQFLDIRDYTTGNRIHLDAEGTSFIKSGNVGIGTSNPTEQLDVAGNIKADSVKATAFEGDGSGLVNVPGLWSPDSTGNVYRGAGNVGIGTSNPTEQLDVAGNIKADSVKATVFEGDGSGLVNVPGLWSPDSTGNVYRGAGNVGIGTASPAYALEVTDTVKAGAVLTSGLDVSGTVNAGEVLVNGSPLVPGGGFWSGDSTNIYYNTGNVGIGTSSPSDNLDVKGEFRITNQISDTYYSRLVTNDDGSFAIKTPAAANNFVIQRDKVGIGTTSPSEKLDVVGTVKATAFEGDGSGLVNVPGLWSPDSTGNVYRSAGNVGIGTTNPSERLEVNGNIKGSNLWAKGQLHLGGFNDIGSLTSQRALVHLPGDRLFMNYAGDFEGGVVIAGHQTVITGNVGIGTTNPGSHKLAVAGSIVAGNIKADTVKAVAFEGDGSGLVNVPGLWSADSSSIYYNTGNVGIGTDSPIAPLTVHQGTNTGSHDGLIIDGDGQTTARLYLDNTVFRLNRGGTDVMSWDTNGRVGIGTTSPSAPLTVHQGTNTGSHDGLIIDGDGQTTARLYLNNAVFRLNRGGTDVMSWDTNGRVGIGTDSPSSQLHISAQASGDAVLTIEADTDNNNESDNPEIRFAQDGGFVHGFIGFEGNAGTRSPGTLTNAFLIGSEHSESSPIQFIDQDEVNMTIRSGNVGIGTTNPSERLEVNGNIKGSNLWAKGQLHLGGFNDIGSLTSQRALAHLPGDRLFMNYAGDFEGGVVIGGHQTVIAGNVGIGTTNPTSKLSIVSNNGSVNAISAVGSSSFYTPNLGQTIASFHSAHQEGLTLKAHFDAGGAGVDLISRGYSSGYGDFRFTATNGSATSTVERMRLTKDGNLGIGTTNPSERLEVNGNIKGSNLWAKGQLHLGGFNDIGSLTSQRALAHLPGDRLFMNYAGDFEGGVVIAGHQTVIAGNVGIGTTNPGTWRLAVNGKVRAKEVKVETGWSDFVFEKDYALPTLEEVESHIAEKGHLQDIPSAEEVEENGIFLGEMNAKLLQKIEELTLYMIKQNKENRVQQAEIEVLKRKLAQLENK